MFKNLSAYIHPIDLSYILIYFFDIVLLNITLSTEKHLYEYIDKRTYKSKYITYMLSFITLATYAYIYVYTNFERAFFLPFILFTILVFLWCGRTKKKLKKYREDYKDK